MPTPIGHSIGGYVAGRLSDPAGRLTWRAAVVIGVILGNLPDADFIPGLLVGEPGAYHRGISHSVGAALAVSLGVAALGGARLGTGFRPLFLIALAAYGSHLVLDAVMPDTRGVVGVPLFWPLSDRYVGYALPVPWRVRYVLDLRLGDDVGGFFGVLLRPRTFLALAVETVLFLPLLALAALAARRRAVSSDAVTGRSRGPGRRGPPSRSRSGRPRSGGRSGA